MSRAIKGRKSVDGLIARLASALHHWETGTRGSSASGHYTPQRITDAMRYVFEKALTDQERERLLELEEPRDG